MPSSVSGELAGDPEGFEVGEGSSAGEMAEMLGPVEHLRERGDGFDLHGGTGAAAVERVVVGVDRHGERVGRARDGVRRLQHLPGVERMGVGVVVVKTSGNFVEDGAALLAESVRGGAAGRRSLRPECAARARRVRNSGRRGAFDMVC